MKTKSILASVFLILFITGSSYSAPIEDNTSSKISYSGYSKAKKNTMLWELVKKREPSSSDEIQFDLLVSSGANVNYVPQDLGYNLLFETIMRNKGYYVEKLIDAGCDVKFERCREQDGKMVPYGNLITYAIDYSIPFSLIEKLVEKGTQLEKVSGTTTDTIDYLIYRKYSNENIKFMLEHGAKAWQRKSVKNDSKLDYGKLNSEPIVRAFDNGNLELVKLLVQYGADIHVKNDRDGSCINKAVASGNLGLVKYCIENGMSVKGKKSEGYLSMIYAMINEAEDVADYLYGLGADPNAKFSDGTPYLVDRLAYGPYGVSDDEYVADMTFLVKAVEKYGLDPLATDNVNCNGIHYAMNHAIGYYMMEKNRDTYYNVSKFLIETAMKKGYKPNVRESLLLNDVEAFKAAVKKNSKELDDDKLFLFAVASRKSDGIQALYNVGKKPDCMVPYYTDCYKNKEAFEVMKKNGFDVNEKVGDKKTPLIASKGLSSYYIDSLVQKGADIFAENIDGKNIFQLAEEKDADYNLIGWTNDYKRQIFKGKKFSPSERIKLRFSGDLESEVVKIISPQDIVVVEKLGDYAFIDGIRGFWVYCSVNNMYCGWCFSGYLKERK